MSVDGDLRGVVRGNVVVLFDAPGIPDGQEVHVSLKVIDSLPEKATIAKLPPSFGAWADEADDTADFLGWLRHHRQLPPRGASS